MSLNLETFNRSNVADTCAVWNVLSSRILYQAACAARVEFTCTGYVAYECLTKPRKKAPTAPELKLQDFLRKEQLKDHFRVFPLSVDDLLDVEVLERRARLGKGELSSIAFASRTGQSFLTDDKKARALAAEVLPLDRVQTTPHLFGWLVVQSLVGDVDVANVLSDHQASGRPLKAILEQVYRDAMLCRLNGGLDGAHSMVDKE